MGFQGPAGAARTSVTTRHTADQDTRAVVERLNEALATSGLSLRQLARALGTSPSRLSSYRAGRVAPSAAFLLRAERIATALAEARREHVPTSIEAAESIRRADEAGDEDWTYALALESRDRLRDLLQHRRALASAWEAAPPTDLDERWRSLFAAFVGHEFLEAGLPSPKWAEAPPLSTPWVLDTPRLEEGEIKRQTPRTL